MKTAIIAVLALILVMGVSGCVGKTGDSASATPTGAAVIEQPSAKINLQEAFAKIQESQTKAEIISFLGEPIEKQQVKSNLEYWYYEAGTDVLQIAFDPDTVSAKRLY